jgi:hypothetical protein
VSHPNAAAQGRRHAVVAAILAGATVGEAAALAGVRRETASRYLAEPAVAAWLATERNALAEQTRHAVYALHREAVGIVLRDLRTGRSPERALAVLRLTPARRPTRRPQHPRRRRAHRRAHARSPRRRPRRPAR